MNDIPLNDLIVNAEGSCSRPLRTRALNALAAAGYGTALDVCRLREDELKTIPGIGSKASFFLRDILHNLGFILRPAPPIPIDPRYVVVLEDWSQGVPVKDTAGKLGVSSSRICQLRPKARRASLFGERYPRRVMAWEAQFAEVSVETEPS